MNPEIPGPIAPTLTVPGIPPYILPAAPQPTVFAAPQPGIFYDPPRPLAASRLPFCQGPTCFPIQQDVPGLTSSVPGPYPAPYVAAPQPAPVPAPTPVFQPTPILTPQPAPLPIYQTAVQPSLVPPQAVQPSIPQAQVVPYVPYVYGNLPRPYSSHPNQSETENKPPRHKSPISKPQMGVIETMIPSSNTEQEILSRQPIKNMDILKRIGYQHN